MASEFLLRALFAGLGVALIAGVLGCFIVWRRMAYYGDSLAHTALLGVALGLALQVNIALAIFLTCFCFALLLYFMQKRQSLAMDTLLGVLSHSALAFGVVAISLLDAPAIELHGFLFGDLLTISRAEVLWIYGGGAVVLALLGIFWQPLLMATISSDLAGAEGENTNRLQLLLIVLLTLTVAVSMRVVGVLLIVALLIIPAASARLLARTPEVMAALSALFGVLAVSGGLFVSLQADVPSGPMIVVFAALQFAVMMLAPPLLRRFFTR